jgi:hypothetical protein
LSEPAKRTRLNEPIESDDDEDKDGEEEEEEEEAGYVEDEVEEELIESEDVPIMKKLSLKPQIPTRSPKPTVDNFYLMNRYTHGSGKEMIMIAMPAMSGSTENSYEAVVSDDGRSLTITWRVPELFFNSNWLLSTQTVSPDSSLIVEWKSNVARNFNDDFFSRTSPSFSQVIQLPTEVERQARCSLLCFPDGNESSVFQIFTVTMTSTVMVHLNKNFTVMSIVRSPQPPNSQGAAAQSRPGTGNNAAFVDADM